MNDPGDRMAEEIPATLENEMRLFRGAIALVAGGGAPRVVVSGVRFGDTLLDTLRRLAAEAGVRVVPLWPADESGVDIAIEPIDE